MGLWSNPEIWSTEPVVLPGPWERGLALDMHSQPGKEEGLTTAGDLLDRFKYAGQRNVGPVIARLVAQVVREGMEGHLPEVVVHVPGARRWGRYFLARRRRIPPQKDLARWDEKKENVRGAFFVRRAEFVRGRRVLLIDDVYDSGATLEECHRVLMEAGAREVMVAAVTKTRFR